MNADCAAFMRNILENPTDYACREVFADWLSEHGEKDFETSIRQGFKVHDHLENIQRGEYLVDVFDHYRPFMVWCWARASEKERFVISWKKLYMIGDDLPYPYGSVNQPNFGESLNRSDIDFAVVDRGFICKLYCSKQFFFKNAVELFSKHPITYVRITDFFAGEHPNGWEQGCNARIRFGVPDPDEDIEEHITEDSIILCPWTAWHDYDWFIEAVETSELMAAISDYLVDFMRKSMGLPELFNAKYPNGRGTWWPLLESEIP